MSAEMGTAVLWLTLAAIALGSDLIWDAVEKSKKRR
jgi:hypothetical protein